MIATKMTHHINKTLRSFNAFKFSPAGPLYLTASQTPYQAILAKKRCGWCLIDHFLSSSNTNNSAPNPIAGNT